MIFMKAQQRVHGGMDIRHVFSPVRAYEGCNVMQYILRQWDAVTRCIGEKERES